MNFALSSDPSPKIAVCLCLDTSGSMTGAPINELNAGIKLFYDSMYSAEAAIITFGYHGVIEL